MNSNTFREIRKWLYAVLIAVGPILTFYGVASDAEVALWIGLGATVIGVPQGAVAVSNLTPKKGSPSVSIDEDPDIDSIDIDIDAPGNHAA